MHARTVGEREYLVVLDRDEEVIASLLEFAAAKGIDGGWVQGLGSLKDIELGFYELEKRIYLKRRFDEDMELGSLQGNLARAGKDRVLHAHAVVSGTELIAFTGHLFEAKIAVTAEFHVRDFGVRVERSEVKSVGLRLICPVEAAK